MNFEAVFLTTLTVSLRILESIEVHEAKLNMKPMLKEDGKGMAEQGLKSLYCQHEDCLTSYQLYSVRELQEHTTREHGSTETQSPQSEDPLSPARTLPHTRTIKLMVMSDLHLEFEDGAKRPGKFHIPDSAGADIVIMAGDIGNKFRGLAFAEATARSTGLPVIYVAGNHEFYGQTLSHHLDKLRQRASATPGVHFLENGSVELCGARFLGCTLWTDYELHGEAGKSDCMTRAKGSMTDFKKIREERAGKFRKLAPVDLVSRHRTSVAYLQHELAQTSLPTIVVTHHAPHLHSLPIGDRDLPLSSAYSSHVLGGTVTTDTPPLLWIHGHIHSASDYCIPSGARGRQTRVVCNPRGYPDELGPGSHQKFAPLVLSMSIDLL